MNDFDKDLLIQIGQVTRELREAVAKKIEPGVDINSLITYLEYEIFSRGYFPSFPAMISINDMAAHYTVFDESRLLEKGDVVKVDFGLSKDGFLTDNAFTIEVSTNNHAELINTAKKCLDVAVETIESGIELGRVGREVHGVAKEHGFETIHNLTGHQIARNVLHYGLCIPSFDNGDTKTVPETSQFAIEPFVTYGQPKIKPVRPCNILQLSKYKPVRDPIAMKLLKHIREYFPHLPFSKRWLVQEILDEHFEGVVPFKGFPKSKVLYAISVLKKHGCIYEYDELGTVDGEIVAQFENCVLFINGEKYVLI